VSPETITFKCRILVFCKLKLGTTVQK
jgi:hypothetical protein